MSPVCEERSPEPGEAGVLTLAAITSGAFLPEEAKAIAVEKVGDNWTTPVSGSILITRASGSKGLVGACALVDRDREDRIVPDTAWQLRFDLEDAPPAEWVLEFLKSPYGRRQILRAAQGSSGIWKITKGSVGQLQVPIPDARVLASAVQLFRAGNRARVVAGRLIDQKRAFKRGLMNDLLTGRRSLGGTASGWRRTSLGTIAETSTARAGRQELPVLSCTKHRGLVLSDDYFGKRVYSKDLSNYRIVHRGELAYATNHLEEGSIGLLEDHPAGLISPMYTVLRVTDSEVEPRFLFALLKSEPFIDRFRQLTSGSVNRRGALRWSTLRSLDVRLPPIAEQRRIVRFSLLSDVEIVALSCLKVKFASLKRGLMQRLLSGEIELPEQLTAVGAAAEASDDDS